MASTSSSAVASHEPQHSQAHPSKDLATRVQQLEEELLQKFFTSTTKCRAKQVMLAFACSHKSLKWL
eukprot:3027682-Amphidinium_carterae.1